MTQTHEIDSRRSVAPTSTPYVDLLPSLGLAPATRAIPAPMAFGAAFRAWLHDPEQADLIAHEYCGWLDDGCAVLALAIQQWLAPDVDLVAVCEGDLVQHVVARIDDRWYLDAGGIWDAQGLLGHWECDHGVRRPRLVPLDHAIQTSWTATDELFRLQPAVGEPLRAPWLVTHEDLASALAERLGHRWNAGTVRKLLVMRPRQQPVKRRARRS